MYGEFALLVHILLTSLMGYFTLYWPSIFASRLNCNNWNYGFNFSRALLYKAENNSSISYGVSISLDQRCLIWSMRRRKENSAYSFFNQLWRTEVLEHSKLMEQKERKLRVQFFQPVMAHWSTGTFQVNGTLFKAFQGEREITPGNSCRAWK